MEKSNKGKLILNSQPAHMNRLQSRKPERLKLEGEIKTCTMNTVKKGSFAASIVLKVGNMRKEDSFVIYPYDGGETIYLQSDKRWIEANLKTGAAKIIKKGVDYANGWKMAFFGHLDIELPAEAVTNLQAHLWNNSGIQGSTVMKYENKELFSV